MSVVVRSELNRQYKKLIDEKNKQIKNLIRNKNKHRLTFSEIEEINIEDQLQIFDSFYSGLESESALKILDYKNDFLPLLVHRSVNRIMPFRESKSEFKDAIIWLTYSRYVESENLDDCILLTNNTDDFCSNKENDKVHPDLRDDTERFKVYNSSHSLLHKENHSLNLVPLRFSKWINSLNIDNDYVFKLIFDNFRYDFEYFIKDAVDEMDIGKLFDENKFERVLMGYASCYNSEIVYCDHVEVTIINEKAIISGSLFGYADYEGYEYNYVRDKDEDRNSYLTDGNASVEIGFSFEYNREEQADELEFNSFEINNLE